MPYIGTKLKELRKREGLSQIELGDKLGISQGTLSSYERNQIAPRMNVIHKISGYFQVDPGDLIINNINSARASDDYSQYEVDLLRKVRKLSDRDKRLLISIVHDIIISSESDKYMQ